MRLDAPSYIHRAADEELFQALCASEFCYVLDTRQIGKTSLLARVAGRLQASRYRVVILDLTANGQNVSVQEWYTGLLQQIIDGLGCLEAAADFWETKGAALGPCQRLFRTIREVFLSADTGPLVIVVDEIDFVRSLPFSVGEFFAAIRECYQRRVHDSRYERLTFFLAGAATPAQLIDDDRITPFNIGYRIELTDFSAHEARPLARGLIPVAGSKEIADRLLNRVLHWTNGHPYLTQRLCRSLTETVTSPASPAATESCVDRICRSEFLSREARETDENLTFVRNRLLLGESEEQKAALLSLYLRVWRGLAVPFVPTDPLASVLRLSGIATVHRGKLIMRNRIYQSAFDRAWVTDAFPGAELRRQKRAFRLGLLRASAIWTVLVLLAGTAWWYSNRARAEHLNAESSDKKNQQLSGQVADKEAKISQLTLVEAQKQAALGTLLVQKREAEAQARKSLRVLFRQKHDAEVLLRQIRVQSAKTVDAGRAFKADARRQLTQAAEDKRKATERLESRNGSFASVLSLRPGREWEALEYGLRAVEPSLKAGRTPASDSLQGLADAVNKGIALRLRLEHPYPVTSLAVSPDNRRLLIGMRGPEAFLWDLETATFQNRLKVNDNDALDSARHMMRSVAFSADGRRVLATSNRDVSSGEVPARRARLYDFTHQYFDQLDTDTNVLITNVEEPLAEFLGPTAAQSEAVLTSAEGEQVLVSDAVTKKERRLLSGPEGTKGGHLNSLASITFPDKKGGRVAAAAQRQGVLVWDADSGALFNRFMSDDSKHEPTAVRFASAHQILFGDRAGQLTLWDLPLQKGEPGVFHRLNSQHAGVIQSVDAWGGAGLLASASEDTTARIWSENPTAPPLLVLGDHKAAVNEVRFVPGRAEIVTGGADHAAEVWALTLRAYCPGPSGITDACFSPNGRIIASVCDNGRIELRYSNFALGAPPLTAVEAGPGVQKIRFSPDGHYLALAGPSDQVSLWQIISDTKGETTHFGKKRFFVSPPEKDFKNVFGLDFSPDGKYLAAGYMGQVRIFSVVRGVEELSKRYDWGGTDFWGIRFAPRLVTNRSKATDSSPMVYYAGTDGLTRGIRLDMPRHIQTEMMPWHRELKAGGLAYANSVDVSPDGKYAATADSNGMVYLYETRYVPLPLRIIGRGLVAILSGHRGMVFSVRFSPDGQTLVSGGKDGEVRLWPLDALKSSPTTGSINPKGPNSTLLEVDYKAERNAKIRGSKIAAAAVVIRAHSDEVRSVCWSPDGQTVLTGSQDGTVRIFPATPQAYVRRAHEILALRSPNLGGITTPPENHLPKKERDNHAPANLSRLIKPVGIKTSEKRRTRYGR